MAVEASKAVYPSRDYDTVRRTAQSIANELGMDVGVERDEFGFRHFLLPRRENRYGHETRCEVVVSERIEGVQLGHGVSR